MAQAIPCSNGSLLARDPRILFADCVRRLILMGGRKGWRSIEVPEGWLQVIRGPRPPAAKWPQAQRMSSAAAKDQVPTTDRQGGRWRNRGVDPDTRKAEACAKVERLHKALDALGTLGGPEVEAIKKSLKKAQEAARERPIPELVKECKEFMERSTERISKLQAELDAETVLLQESRARLASLESQQAATPATPGDTARGAQVVNLQQMVNQLQAERVALSVELRQSRVAKDRTPWSGDAPPDVIMIPALPEDHQAIEEWMASRNRRFAGRSRVRVSRRDLVRTRSTKIGSAEGIRSCVAVHGGSDFSRKSHGCPHRRIRRQAKVCRRRRALNLLTFRGRCRRCEARYGLRSVRVGEALHPGPAARPLRRSARLRAQEVSPTAVDSPSVLDALEFDLTVEDSTESECGELEGSQLPEAKSRPLSFAPEVVGAPAPEDVVCARTQLHDLQEDVVPRDGNCEGATISGRRLRLQWDPARGVSRDHRTVQALQMFRDLSRRIGVVQAGSALPRALTQQRWSPVNVPLIWEAAGESLACPVFDWLCTLTSSITANVEFHENNLSVSEAVVVALDCAPRCAQILGCPLRRRFELLVSRARVSGSPTREPFLGEGTRARVAAGQRGRCTRCFVRVCFRDSGVAHGPTRTCHWSNTRSTGQPRSVTNCWSCSFSKLGISGLCES